MAERFGPEQKLYGLKLCLEASDRKVGATRALAVAVLDDGKAGPSVITIVGEHSRGFGLVAQQAPTCLARMGQIRCLEF